MDQNPDPRIREQEDQDGSISLLVKPFRSQKRLGKGSANCPVRAVSTSGLLPEQRKDQNMRS
jgi:hypothetical protein